VSLRCGAPSWLNSAAITLRISLTFSSWGMLSSSASMDSETPRGGSRAIALPMPAASGRSTVISAASFIWSLTYSATTAPPSEAGWAMGPPVSISNSRPTRPSSSSRTSCAEGSGVVVMFLSQEGVDGLAEGLRGEGLRHEEQRAGRLGLLAHLGRALGRHEPQRGVVALRAQGAQEVDAGHVRHVP